MFPAWHGNRDDDKDKLNHNKIQMKEEADCRDDGVRLSLKDEWMNDFMTQRRRNIESGAQDRHD